MGTEAECGLAALYLAADATFCTGIDLLLSGGAELNYGLKSQIPSWLSWSPTVSSWMWNSWFNTSSWCRLCSHVLGYKYREDFYSIKSKFIHLMSKLNGWDKFGILTNCNKTSAPPHRSTNQHQPSLTSNNLPFLSLPVSANQMLRFCHASSDFLNETSLVNVTVQYNYRAVLLNILRVSFSTNVIVSSHKAMRVMLNYKPKQVGKKS